MGVAFGPGSAVVRRVLVLAAALLVSVVGVSTAQAAVGTQDYSFASATHQPTAPTGEKPQSKLWFNDGYWWGSMWSVAKSSYDIQRFDPATNGWIDTGVVIDPRDKSQADMLWDGTHLYALSNVHQMASTLDPAVRLYRFSYNTTTRTYAPDAGFPVGIFTPASSQDLETSVIDKDSTGELWATFTYANIPGNCVTPATCPAGRSVYITHSTTSDAVWTAPVVLPSPRAGDVSGNDISSIVHFGNKIGVLFSDQVKDPAINKTGDYFAWHLDGTPDTVWTTETALYSHLAADDHINLKAAPDGRLFAAVKTSLNDAGSPVPGDTLIYLLERATDGTWTKTPFATVASEDTRSQILLDPAQNAIYQFATLPPNCDYEAGGWITCKVTSMDSPSFNAADRGTLFMQFADGDHLNNFSSTKQTVGPDTGLLGVSADDQDFHYAHNSLALTGSTPSCSGAPLAPPSNPIIPPPPAPPVTPPVTKPVVAPPVVTPVTTTVVPVKPVVTTSSAPCRVVSSTIKVRSLSSRFSELKRNAAVRLRVRATCSVRLKIAAALGTAKGAIVARANVFLKRGPARTVTARLTSVGRKLLLHRLQARLVITTRTPAVKGLSPARLCSTAIAFR
jgi:hypothetical protein